MELRDIISNLIESADEHASELAGLAKDATLNNQTSAFDSYMHQLTEVEEAIEQARKLLKNDPDRLERAYRYLTGTMTEYDGIQMIRAGREAAYVYALESIADDEVLDDAKKRWEDHPELKRLAQQATAHVGSKWIAGGEIASEARGWALDIMAKDARQEGIDLVEKE